MDGKITVKEAKEKLRSLLEILETTDENTPFSVDVNDNFGGSYIGDIQKWKFNLSCAGTLWLSVE